MPRAASLPAAAPAFRRWSCTHFGREAEIDVWVEATGTWETVATIRPVGDQDAEDIAGFIVEALNRAAGM